MTGAISGRYIPGDSILHRMDPRAKLFGFIILIVAVIFTNSIIGYAVMAALIFAMACAAGMGLKVVFGSARRLWSFFLIIFLMNAFFYSSEDPIWSFWIFTLSKEGLIQGTNVVLRILLIIVMSSVLTMTTKPLGIMTALETLVKPLKFIKLPAEEMAMILSIALQFIPTLLEESSNIKKAQIARGARFESGKLRERAMALVPMLIPIFLSAFKRADELSVAMEARGYRGAKNRTPRKEERMSITAVLVILLCAGICVLEYFI
ncbi:MAG: energy-coupling factor transporter transmembrane component T [Bacillota bacterium]|nr:energy-coupling factor transporter transmembrane component T [Bacillota bacterium]